MGVFGAGCDFIADRLETCATPHYGERFAGSHDIRAVEKMVLKVGHKAFGTGSRGREDNGGLQLRAADIGNSGGDVGIGRVAEYNSAVGCKSRLVDVAQKIGQRRAVVTPEAEEGIARTFGWKRHRNFLGHGVVGREEGAKFVEIVGADSRVGDLCG